MCGPAGQHAPMASHGSGWAKQLEQAHRRRGSISNPPTDPDSSFLAINDHNTEAAKTLILMEFADIGSLDQYAVRTSFKRNLVGDHAVLARLACYEYLLSSAHVAQAFEVLFRLLYSHPSLKAYTETILVLRISCFQQKILSLSWLWVRYEIEKTQT